jgi:hypothetical protein
MGDGPRAFSSTLLEEGTSSADRPPNASLLNVLEAAAKMAKQAALMSKTLGTPLQLMNQTAGDGRGGLFSTGLYPQKLRCGRPVAPPQHLQLE